MPAAPTFLARPYTYLRWAAREYPALYYSVLIGTLGPVILVTIPPLRMKILGGEAADNRIPQTYPVPRRPRRPVPPGFEDDE